MSMRKRKKVQILSREELMLRRWDFGLVPSERSLEAVGKSVDLHNIGRSMAFDLFPRTYRGKNRCVLRQKHVLINSRERARIWLHTRHQDEAIEPCGDGVPLNPHKIRVYEGVRGWKSRLVSTFCQRFFQPLSKVDGIFEDIYAFGCHCICSVGINLKCGADVGVA